ncbi:MAG: glycosyltransferase family A protein [Patescibacteria group bacterium]|jgi:glycosyltransferase involved in cell wall biosynthesis
MIIHNSVQNKSFIDVIIPVYNGQDFIIQAIQSVEKQTYPPNKIIIIDDGSTDDTANFINSHRGIIPIQYIKKEHGGLSSARNKGIQNSTNEYIAFLDADDEWYPNKLEEQIKLFHNKTNENLGVVYCQYDIINEAGHLTDKYYIQQADPLLRGGIFKKLLPLNKITGSASGVLVKRECFDKTSLFDEKMTAYEDWDMWLRLAEYYEFDFVNINLVKIRRYSKNMQNDKLHMFSNALTFYNKWILILPEKINIPRIWAEIIIEKVLTRLPRVDFIKLLNKHLSKSSRKKLIKLAICDLKVYLLKQFISIPYYMLINIAGPIKNITVRFISSLFNRCGRLPIYIFDRLQKFVWRYFPPHVLKSNPGKESFIFTEIYGCAKIGKIALDSFSVHHPNTTVHIFGTPNDFNQIEKRTNFIFHDISAEKLIIHNFNYGHLGTASLWAKVILDRKEKYIIHFDSDVIFRDRVFDDIIKKLIEGYSIVGPIRNYKHNPNNRDDIRHLPDLTQTLCFGFDREKITGYNYKTLTKMCQGGYNPLGHPVIDFFDPVMFDILHNRGTVYHLNQDEFGGCDFYGKRVNKYPAINALIDFGNRLAHFAAVGSGMYYFNNKDKILDNIPKSYVNFAIEKYAIFCKIFYNEDLNITYDKDKYQPLLSIKDWYNK